MLPFTKRPVRSDEPSELIKTNELEVDGVSALRAARSAAAEPVESSRRPSPVPSAAVDVPRAFAPSTADDEMTMLMPRKGMTFSARPPAPVAPNPMPKLTASRSPRPQLEEPPTRQFIKPSAPPPSISATAATVAASAPERPQTPAPVQLPRTGTKPQPAALDAKPAAPSDPRGSDPRLDPPATVITARTRIVAARPTVSWAAALVAMGVFVGLVTAVVARGDADTLLDAAASFVDPSGTHAAAASTEPTATVRTKAVEVHSKVVATTDILIDDAPTPVAASSLPEAPAAAPPRPAPVAFAAPVRRVARPAARPAPAHEERVAKAAPAPKPAPAAAKKASDDDVESASAADALAKAQLEAS
ncbi:MAG TPA: hypothetical protein VGI39_38265, partial [Polyangiaceae bacterium]